MRDDFEKFMAQRLSIIRSAAVLAFRGVDGGIIREALELQSYELSIAQMAADGERLRIANFRREGGPRSQFDPGLCPECHNAWSEQLDTPGVFHDNWFVCHRCKTCFVMGANLLNDKDRWTPEELERNLEVLKPCRVVEAYFRPFADDEPSPDLERAAIDRLRGVFPRAVLRPVQTAAEDRSF